MYKTNDRTRQNNEGRKPPPIIGILGNFKRHQTPETSSTERNNGVMKGKMSASTRAPLVRVMPAANVQTGYAQVINQQHNLNDQYVEKANYYLPYTTKTIR